VVALSSEQRGAAPRRDRRVRRSVRGKLFGTVLLTTALALLVAGIAMLTHDLSVSRESWATDIATEANVLALSTAPALAFDDRAVAERNLAALQARRDILATALYRADGRLYADYVRPGAAALTRTLELPQGTHIRGEQIEVVQHIAHNDERLGTIYLRAHYDVLGRVQAYVGILALVTLLSMLIALAFSAGLQRVITRPLEGIASVARQVVEERDYSLRAQTATDDEFGLVTEAFNDMLNEVQQRTRALEASNVTLRNEVATREAAEEALREADRRKDEFLATLAHELRNPLAPIRHATRILESSAATEAQKQWAREVIARQVQHMALLLDDLLEISRITRGRLELKKEYVSLDKLVASAVETARPLIDAKQHTLEVRLPDEPIGLYVDPLRMSQALSNILTNAAKYTDAKGQITLTATADENGVDIAVSDTGIGLSEAALPKVFEMFSQVEGALERSQGGLGIGLSLVRGLVTLHGGTVSATSPGLGHGSTFTIHLSEASLIQPALRASVPVAPVAAVSSLTASILVADDNRDSAESLSVLLRVAGHRVSQAHSGNEALATARRERSDVLILDIGMPDRSGYEVAEELRRERWAAGALFIALTGWGQRDDKERALRAGFDRHFTKPIDAQELEAAIAQHLQQRATQARSLKNTVVAQNPPAGNRA
jgi:two-component system, sensor histidine kinase